MTGSRILRCCCRLNFILFIVCSWVVRLAVPDNQFGTNYNTYTISSFSYPRTRVKAYDARNVRVDLPQWFSSVSISVESNVNTDYENLIKDFTSTEPIICFRDGSPPVPDILNSSCVATDLISNISFGKIRDSQSVQCYRMQQNFTLRLTNQQISPGVWYVGFSNGIGPTMTQSKMIVRRPGYVFSANITIEGCVTSSMWGENCNQTVYPLSCYRLDNQTTLSCTALNSCQVEGSQNVYSLDVLGVTGKLIITAKDVSKFTMTKNETIVTDIASLVLLARYGGIPTATIHDYSQDVHKSPLVIQSPQVGRWFIAAMPVNTSIEVRGNKQFCYSIESQLISCPMGKYGDKCTEQIFELQTAIRRNSFPFESYFLPISQDIPLDLHSFSVETLSNNSQTNKDADHSWAYLIFNIPQGAAGVNLHIQLSSATKMNYEVYLRFGALPSLDKWDFYYANRTRSSDSSMFYKSYSQSDKTVDFYILYIKEGTWSIGLRNLESNRTSDDQTMMTVSLERCAKRCSSRGTCNTALDASGLTSYSYCSCGRTHGGIDCGIEIVSHKKHIWESIALVASNGVAVFPALWSLRKKAFAEWVLFTSSGISSGLYHACDVGAWCALSFGVLQFMDFWLSFMAVVSTFVYMTTIDETSKRTIHTVVAILTALLAITNATRSSNIALVMAIGALGLLVGWMIEFSTNRRPFSAEWFINMAARWRTIKEWMKMLIKTIIRRFRCGFIVAALVALVLAAVSWKLESSESYWVWHSLWHVSIYTSSFLFLCSKADDINDENNRVVANDYALTRQDSSQG